MFTGSAFRKPHYRLYKLLPFLEKRASIILDLPPEPVIVDVGSSIGRNLEGFQILRKDLAIHAVDIGDFRGAIESKGCIFHQIDLIIDPLPFDSESVDCVTAMHILEHLESVGNLLGEARRVLKPHGKLFIEVPGVRSLFVPSFHFSRSVSSHTLNFYDDPTHLRPYSVNGLRRLLEDNGLRVIRSGISRNWLFFILSPLLIGCGLFSPFLFHAGIINLVGWSVYCIAEPRK
jgi:SAM-dependent methyltransferase